MIDNKWGKKEIIRYYKQTKRKPAGEVIAKDLLRITKKYIGKSVLDVGAGTGALIKQIPKSKGIDLAPRNKNIIKAGIENIPFREQEFDTVFCTEVLEHLNNKILQKGLREVYRVLKKGGYFIITVPYDEDLKAHEIFCPKCGARFHRVGHIQSFNEKTISKLLEKNKFKIILNKTVPFSYFRQYPYLRPLLQLLANKNIIKNKKLLVVAQK